MEANKKISDKITVMSLLVALGIIYGDIGTSPLYVMKAIIGDKPISEILVYGGVSCVIWTLVFQTTVKYMWLTLKADNDGEGGIFSLYALVKRYGKKLVIPTILGATTLLADGIITPPITIASAVEGLDMITPNLATVPIVVVIICMIFFFQRFGTQKIGSAFGPLMFIWFGMLFIVGITQVFHFPDVLKAINPYYAIVLLTQYPKGFWLLGAVFLCTTGAEALYSDLGHCGKKNIRITWVFVKLSLVFNYLGQASWLMHHAGSSLGGRNPFFEMMPQWFILPGIIIATIASIIASQALISGSYTLIHEAMNLNFWPRVSVKHPTVLKGQIYIPSVNTILWAGCILMILYFRNSTNMEAAYGFSITVAMMMTTFLLSYFLIYKRKWNIILVILILILFGVVESSFFITNIAKIKQRWMFLFFELFIFLTMYTWYYARQINNKYLKFIDFGKYTPKIKELSEDLNVQKFSTHLIYLTKADRRNEIEDKIINSIFSNKPKRADIYWIFHINRIEQPYTLNYDVTELVESKVIRINLNVGFRIQPRTELYFKMIVQELLDTKEIDLKLDLDYTAKYNCKPDFKFVILEKYLSVENEFTLSESVILNSYFMLKRLGQSDEKAFGIDKSDAVVEFVPMIFQPIRKFKLVRNIK